MGHHLLTIERRVLFKCAGFILAATTEHDPGILRPKDNRPLRCGADNQMW
jgi:hypothetical protein